jgi:hypothetical protein
MAHFSFIVKGVGVKVNKSYAFSSVSDPDRIRKILPPRAGPGGQRTNLLKGSFLQIKARLIIARLIILYC